MKIFQRAQRAPRSPESFLAAIYKAFDESQRSPQRAPRAPFQRLTRLGHWSPPNYQLSKSKARQTGRAHLTPATAKPAALTAIPDCAKAAQSGNPGAGDPESPRRCVKKALILLVNIDWNVIASRIFRCLF